MKQKFRRFTRVKIAKEMPSDMRHFTCNCQAIIEGSYSQLYGGRDVDSYSVYLVRRGKIINHVSWYPEKLLTALPKQDRAKAEAMVEAWNLRQEPDVH